MKTIGFVVNPIAGMGGAVGLKGTDGQEILKKAISLGAKAIAPARAEEFLSELKPMKRGIRLIAGSGIMGEEEAKNQGFSFLVISERQNITTAEDTKAFGKSAYEKNVDILVFCGGDGTARDILDVVDTKMPVLGVPTGVKMQSAVFAVNPRAAARIVMRYLFNEIPLREAEVMDVDEEAYRKGELSSKLYGYMLVPYEPRLIQTSKLASPSTEIEIRNQAGIAIYIIEEMKKNVIYIVGPGTTTRTIADLLDEKKTLLGTDLFLNKKIIAHDVNEKQILKKIEEENAKIIITPIGGQGFIFGRGNQQISPVVIRKVGVDNIIVIATKHKMREIQNLRVDTGDVELDNELKGNINVIIDYREKRTTEIE